MRIEDTTLWLGPTQPDDAGELDEYLRPEDRYEVEELSRRSSRWVIDAAIARSEHPVTFRTLDGDRILGIYGFTLPTPLSTTAAPWMLGTSELFDHRKVLVRRSRVVIENMLKHKYRRLSNVVWAGNHKSVRYIRALGFKIGPVENSLFGTPFRRFSLERDDV